MSIGDFHALNLLVPKLLMIVISLLSAFVSNTGLLPIFFCHYFPCPLSLPSMICLVPWIPVFALLDTAVTTNFALFQILHYMSHGENVLPPSHHS